METGKHRHNQLASNRGVTLLELLIATAIFAVVVAGIYSSFLSQKKIYHAQQQTTQIQQNIRAAMYMMEKQLRMAGYDPNGKGYGISDITNNSITFSHDDGSGTANTITYAMSGSDLQITLNANDPAILAENIYNSGASEGFAIAYAFDNDGDGVLDTVNGSVSGNIIWAIDTDNDNLLDLRLDTNNDGVIDANDDEDHDGSFVDGVTLNPQIPITAIRAVKVWLLAQADRPDVTYHENNIYVVGRRIITTDDKIRRRMMSCCVKCRNL